MKKYGVLDFDLTVEWYWNNSWNHKALLNIGDAAQYIVCEQFLTSLGIDKKDIVRLSMHNLIDYNGDEIVVPLNFAFDSYVGYNEILEKLSPKITPIFLGMSFTDLNLSVDAIECLKHYSPVGCRDERSYDYLQSLGIPCYLNGCCTVAIDIEKKRSLYDNKIVFIDVPINVLQYIPDCYKKDIVFFNQEIYCKKEEMNGLKPANFVDKCISLYGGKPKLIVTSRFHGGALSLSNEIPALILIEKYTFRFSWIANYYPIYTEDSYANIDWLSLIKKCNFAYLKTLVLKIAKDRILGVVNSNDLSIITKLQKRKQSIDESLSSNQVLYFKDVWLMIQKTWKKENEYLFAFWGVNDNSKVLLELIKKEYPKSRLVAIYDLFKQVNFCNLSSEHPSQVKKYKNHRNFYVIVTAYLASRIAYDVFEGCGFPIERSFLCNRRFVTYDDINKE